MDRPNVCRLAKPKVRRSKLPSNHSTSRNTRQNDLKTNPTVLVTDLLVNRFRKVLDRVVDACDVMLHGIHGLDLGNGVPAERDGLIA